MINKYFLLLFFLVLINFIGCYSVCAKKVEQQKHYNVLFVAVDDLNDWIGAYGGNPQTITPNLDVLASKGVTFTNAQCAVPLCNPSRTAIMTGIRASTSGVYRNSHLFREAEVLKNIQTIPQYFSSYGYKTMSMGKIFHHPEGVFADSISWDKMKHLTGVRMNKHSLKSDSMNANGMPVKNSFQRGLDWGVIDKLSTPETSDYQTAKWAANELRKNHEKPFFLACGIFRPHLPWFLPQKYFDKFPLESIQLPDIDENDLDDIPRIGQHMSGGLDPENDYLRIKKYKKQKEAVQAYLAAVNYADECVGVLMDVLAKSEYADNTIVVFWGDHGWHLGEKLHYRKFVLWEESCRVPLMMVVPGLTEKGVKCSRPVNLIDLYPTLIELCNLPRKDDLQGMSIVPLLKDISVKWDRPSLSTMGPNRHSLRSEQYRFIQYEDGSEELYDHCIDPTEINNLANKKEYEKVLKEFRTWLPVDNVPEIKNYKKKK